MTTSVITPNAFIGQTHSPTDEDLSRALGSAKPVWDQIVADLATEYGAATQEWKCYSPRAGWSLRLLRKKRTVVWLSPCEGCFRIMFILGDKAIHAAQESDLSPSVLKIIDQSEKYPEGTGVRLDIKDARDVATVKKLAAIKLAN